MHNESAPPEDQPLPGGTVESKRGKLFIRAIEVIFILASIATVADWLERHLH